ncbi:hypothetical protein [Psychrobacter sp. FDAARGOS_221]|uniref:hypothetical protein n=1 Tax=Psychrobacter sp. FDAARGOS_221 TaxID=1975705 RepID=UPI000BB59A89|nr:hypothetical protein [Psychrobacter sp. FDAARGOS_221]PNK61550.1 hypothetical protein A6J60_012195 [Psychrobacter sp. FDAARGOS_221]
MKKQNTGVGLGFNIISALLAFMLWGSWAYYVNAGAETRLISALTQGFASFCITLVLVRMVTYIFNRLPPSPLRVVLPALLSVSVTGCALILAHTLARTSNIVYTIAPALTVAFIFCVFTALKLQKLAAHEKDDHV